MKNDSDLIISLTSYPGRISVVHKTVESLLNQTVRPDLVVLWLAPEQFPNKEKDLPDTLRSLIGHGLTVDWYADIRSYKKLIPTLIKYPNATIITADDDIIYPRNMVADLLDMHKRRPMDICAHRIRKINIKHNRIMPYINWHLSERRHSIFNLFRRHSYKFLCGTGAGTLYPPHSLHPDVLNADKFICLCPHQDDIWFWAMAVHNNRKISPTNTGYKLSKHVINQVQSTGLWDTVNSAVESPNNTAINNVINEYPDIAEKIGLII